ncbi:hypothetical protein BpHYR1_003450 [Brachionus plicatilis]|uniref:Uncharacterized protein n=1 Tax=Brachionus plicatilis TaxID=10195 RepID=A0A3M7TAP4_BRAPC|nr:hypothetical protein BpHYR1_003450 [Brachionus plicatilis]
MTQPIEQLNQVIDLNFFFQVPNLQHTQISKAGLLFNFLTKCSLINIQNSRQQIISNMMVIRENQLLINLDSKILFLSIFDLSFKFKNYLIIEIKLRFLLQTSQLRPKNSMKCLI